MTQRLNPITTDRIDPDAAKVVRRLNRHGHEAYLVGGCVRDLLLGRTPKDFDVATDATPEQLKALFRNCRIIGRRFRLAHIFFGRKIIETATFRTTPRPLDESEDPMIWHDNEFGTAEEDARRRDFTINGLFYDISAGQVIDTVEGLMDLRAGRVRIIGEPHVRTQEDPVRILRAIKFTSRLDMQLDEGTREALVHNRGLIADCSIARVLEEIYRLLRSGTAATAFRQLHELGILEVLFPELTALLPPSSSPGTEGEVPAVRAGRRRRPKSGARANADGAVEDAQQTAPTDEGPLDDGSRNCSDPAAPPDAEANPEGPDEDEPPASEREAARLLVCQLGLSDEAARIAAGQLLFAQLEALDAIVQRSEHPPPEPVLLGAVLSPLASSALADDQRMGQTVEGIDLLVSTVARRIHVSRRHRERLKQILVAQRRLANRRRRRNLKERDYYGEARILLRLRAEAAGEPDPLLLSTADTEGSTGRRKRGRRRRGGRRRNKGRTTEQAPAPDGAS